MRALVLRSLCAVADGGTGELSSLHTAHGEPFFRPFVRISVRRALSRAAVATTHADPEHVARLAFLRALGGAASQDPNDAQAIAFAYETAAAPFRKAGGGIWPISTLLLLAVVASVGVFAWLRLRPTAEEKFMSSAFGKALGEPLGQYVVALDEGKRAIEDKRDALLTSGVRAQLGDDLAGRFEDVLVQAAKAKDPSTDGEALRRSIEQLDGGLAGAHVPAFLDAYYRGEGERRALWLMAFYAEDRARVSLAGQTLSVVHARRLDTLNLETSYVAWRRDGSEWLAVSQDLLEVELAKDYLPSIGGDRDLQLGDRAEAPKLGEIQSALTTSMRTALPAAAKVDPGEIRDVREIVDARQASVVRLLEKKRVLMGEGSLLLTPPRYAFLSKYREKEHDVDDFLKAHDRLAMHREAIGRMVSVLAAITEEELASWELLRRAKVKASKAAEADGVGASEGPLYASYLIVYGDARLEPAIVLERACREVARGRTAAYVATTAIARELGASKESLDGRWDEALLTAVKAILAKPPAEVRAAAARVYERWIGAPPSAYERKPF
jgi:hypothetical protein